MTSTPTPPLPAWAAPRRVALLVGLLTVVRLVFDGLIGLSDDEAYYWLWSTSVSYGYYDHPPMVAWLIRASTTMFGDGPFGVRALGTLLAGAGSFFLYRTIMLVFEDRLLAARAVVWLQATLLVGIGSIVITPDNPSVLFWGMAVWAAAHIDRTDDGRWWLLVGLFAGLGTISKYSVLFLGVGLVIWLLVVPSLRKWFRRWELWAGGALALLIFLPVLVWNAQHDWASFQKQFGRTLVTGLETKWALRYLASPFVLLTPIIAGFAVAGLIAAGRRVARSRDPGMTLLLATIAPIYFYLLFHSFRDRVQGNWLAPIYPTLAAFAALGASLVEKTPGRHGRIQRGLRRAAAPIGFALVAVALVHAAWPVTNAMRWRDRTSETRGWSAFAADVDAARAEAGAAWIATHKYGLTAHLRRQLPGVPVFQVNQRIRYAAEPEPPLGLLSQPGLFVALDRRHDHALLHARFASIERRPDVVRRAPDGSIIVHYRVFRVSAPKDGGPLRD